MKKYSLLFWFTAIAAFCSAQSLTFQKTEHNFSKIKETDGEVTYSFTYENRSKVPVIIITTDNPNRALRVNFKRDTIQPKTGKGSIDITLNPRNLSGAFNHTFHVKTMENGVNRTYALTVKADIEPRPRTKEEIYGMKEGNLRYKNNSLRYEKMIPASVIVDTFFIYNVSTDTMTFSYKSLPKAVNILSMPEKLVPNGEGKIIFEYNAAKKNDWGSVYDRINLTTNDAEKPAKTLYITGNIYDDFSNMTEAEKANAARAAFDNTEYDFGTGTVGDEKAHDYIITNTGKSTLYIRKLKASCGCTAVNPEKRELEPGESTAIKLIYRTHGKNPGKQMRTVDVITNDPTQPKITLKITGHLNAKPAEQPAAN